MKLELVNDPNEPTLPNVVFIHGLGGDFRSTWMHDSAKEDSLWPRWVGEDMGCCAWLLGYGASLSRWTSDASALPRQATAVAELLCAEPRLFSSPIVLVGHSLGGLVIKSMLQQGFRGDTPRFLTLARSVKGVAFIGTPHFGSGLASLAKRIPFFRHNPNLENLRSDDAYLEDLNKSFRALCAGIGVRTYVETQPIPPPLWLGGGLWPGTKVVSPSSSEPHVPGEVGIPIEANHVTICKPKGRDAAIHVSLTAFIKEIQRDLGSLRAPVELIDPANLPKAKTHCAVATFAFPPDKRAHSDVVASVYLLTDSPDRLKQQLDALRTDIQRDPLIAPHTKQSAKTGSLSELATLPGLRVHICTALEAMSFSAYLYFSSRDDIELLSPEKMRTLFLVNPLVHRLSKKSEIVEFIHTSVPSHAQCTQDALDEIQKKYHRQVQMPQYTLSKYATLEELANLIAQSSALHISGKDTDSIELFESLRTRIRYAENVITGEKHKRDINPLQ